MIHLKKLNDRKLNIYRIIAPAGVVSTLLITYLEMSRLPLTMFDYISRAVIIIVYTVLTYQLWFREGAGPLFERTVFWIIALFFGSQFFRLVYNLHIDDYSNALLTLPHWLPIVYLMAFLTFDFNQAIKAGSAFFITILLPGIFFIVLHPESVHLSHIINIYVSNIIYLFVIYATGSLMRQYAQSELLKQQAEKENRALQEALDNIKTLRGLIPICASCKMIRDDEGYWHDVAVYVRNHSEADFSHGLCPECAHNLYPNLKLGRD